MCHYGANEDERVRSIHGVSGSSAGRPSQRHEAGILNDGEPFWFCMIVDSSRCEKCRQLHDVAWHKGYGRELETAIEAALASLNARREYIG